MKLLIVRHAQSQGNATGKYSALDADSLSAQGKEQAVSLVESLKTWDFEKILVSPFERALQTVAPYLEATDQRAEIWPEIAEGCWHGKREEPSETWKPKPATLPDAVAHLFSFRDGEAISPIPHAESFGEGILRIQTAFNMLQKMADTSTGNVLMVTHGYLILEMINLMLGTCKPVQFKHVNCGMTSMFFDGVWNMEYCNRRIGRDFNHET